MQPEAIVYVIDDDDAVRQSLEFLLKTAAISTRGFELGKGISGSAAGYQIGMHHNGCSDAGDHRHRPIASAER